MYGDRGSVLSTVLINHIISIHHIISTWAFRKKSDTDV